jgi:putative transcriptional regulator
MTLRWKLRVAMAERGVFTMAELGRRMEERGGYHMTPPALHRLAGGKTGGLPKELKLATLNAILDALEFPTTDLGIVQYEPPTPFNQVAQPLVVNSDVRLRAARRPEVQRPRQPKPGRMRRVPPPDD